MGEQIPVEEPANQQDSAAEALHTAIALKLEASGRPDTRDGALYDTPPDSFYKAPEGAEVTVYPQSKNTWYSRGDTTTVLRFPGAGGDVGEDGGEIDRTYTLYDYYADADPKSRSGMKSTDFDEPGKFAGVETAGVRIEGSNVKKLTGARAEKAAKILRRRAARGVGAVAIADAEKNISSLQEKIGRLKGE